MNKDNLIGAIGAMLAVIGAMLILPLFGIESSIVGMLAMLAYYVVYYLVVRHKEERAQLDIEKRKRLLHEDYLNRLSYDAENHFELVKRKREDILGELNSVADSVEAINREIYGGE